MPSTLEEAIRGGKPEAPRDPPDPARVRAALDALRPGLLADGGNVELAGVDVDGTVRLVLQGECRVCPSVELTFRRVLEPVLRSRVPGIVTLLIE